MMSRRRRLLVFAAAFLGLMALLLIVIHLGPVQRWAWGRVAAAISSDSDWQVTCSDPRFRLWPGRLVATDITVAASEQPLLQVDRIAVRWGWWAAASAPRRVESLEITGLVVDLDNLPPADDQEPEPTTFDPWTMLEVGELQLRQGSVNGAVAGFEVTMAEVTIGAALVAGNARLGLAADRISLGHQGRLLELGRLDLAAQATASTITVERCTLAGDTLDLDSKITVASEAEANHVAGEVSVSGDLEPLLAWWDPALADQLTPRGRLVLTGSVEQVPGGQPTLDLRHTGDPVAVAGFVLDQLVLTSQQGQPRVDVAGSAWGSASA